MEIFIENQLIIILYSLLLGLIFGAGYDIIRIADIMMGEFRLKSVPLFFLDLSYMIALTAGISLFAYGANHGDIRLFLLLPMGAGFWVWHCTLGRAVIFFSEAIIRFLRFLFRILILVPLRAILRCVKRAAAFLFRVTVIPCVGGLRHLSGVARTKRQKKRLRRTVRI